MVVDIMEDVEVVVDPSVCVVVSVDSCKDIVVNSCEVVGVCGEVEISNFVVETIFIGELQDIEPEFSYDVDNSFESTEVVSDANVISFKKK